MKKMMIIAVMMGAMLIPAQMMASNKVNNKAKVEYRNGKKNDKKPKMNYKDFDKGKKKGYNYYANKKPYKPNKPKVVVVNRPAPVPPPPPVRVVYESNPVNAVASVIGLAALAAIIAN